jgi:hypothetical protein
VGLYKGNSTFLKYKTLKSLKMKSLNFTYNNQQIEFLQGDNNIMVNATQMAKVFNKRIDFFLKSDNTKAFIKVLKFPPYGGNLKPLKDVDIIKSKGRLGTFMHRILALKFAAWLDPKFELWVFSTIDKIIFAQFQEIKETTVAKLKLEKERDLMLEELLKKHPDDFYKFLELEGKLTKANRKRIRAIRESVNELKLNLFPEDITKIQ